MVKVSCMIFDIEIRKKRLFLVYFIMKVSFEKSWNKKMIRKSNWRERHLDEGFELFSLGKVPYCFGQFLRGIRYHNFSLLMSEWLWNCYLNHFSKRLKNIFNCFESCCCLIFLSHYIHGCIDNVELYNF